MLKNANLPSESHQRTEKSPSGRLLSMLDVERRRRARMSTSLRCSDSTQVLLLAEVRAVFWLRSSGRLKELRLVCKRLARGFSVSSCEGPRR